MEKVTGIGGVFFRAKEPEELSNWYETHLGVERVGKTYEDGSWWQDEGPTVFTPFKEDAEHFGASQQSWMINFRVKDLDAMVKQLRAAGIKVELDPKTYPNGRFARLSDPEGNPIELWQAAGTDAKRPARN
ncbi:MAG: VOC family protein [Trueperaceae bacterium]|nr:VOC family protein [Trueperaceae bacterium]